MDTGRGNFDAITGEHFRQMLEESRNTGDTSRIDKVFTPGETVSVKNSKFVIKHIDHLTGIMVLKLLPEKRF